MTTGMWALFLILKDLDTDKMIEYIYEGRRDGSRNKKFLADWDS